MHAHDFKELQEIIEIPLLSFMINVLINIFLFYFTVYYTLYSGKHNSGAAGGPIRLVGCHAYMTYMTCIAANVLCHFSI